MIQALIGPIANLAGSWLQGKADKHSAEAELKLTEAEAKAKILMMSKETSVADWERIMAQGSQSSLEGRIFCNYFKSIPLILCWIPGTEGWVDRGFEQLSKAPDWYFYSLGIAISCDRLVLAWRTESSLRGS